MAMRSREEIAAELAELFANNEAACLQTLNHLAEARYNTYGIETFAEMAGIYMQALPSLMSFNPDVFEVVKEML